MNPFIEKREKTKKRLGKVERIVKECFDNFPNFIELSALNHLVRYIWRNYGEDIPVGSITRVARKLRATGEYDTKKNIQERSNLEVAHREFFKK